MDWMASRRVGQARLIGAHAGMLSRRVLRVGLQALELLRGSIGAGWLSSEQ